MDIIFKKSIYIGLIVLFLALSIICLVFAIIYYENYKLSDYIINKEYIFNANTNTNDIILLIKCNYNNSIIKVLDYQYEFINENNFVKECVNKNYKRDYIITLCSGIFGAIFFTIAGALVIILAAINNSNNHIITRNIRNNKNTKQRTRDRELNNSVSVYYNDDEFTNNQSKINNSKYDNEYNRAVNFHNSLNNDHQYTFYPRIINNDQVVTYDPNRLNNQVVTYDPNRLNNQVITYDTNLLNNQVISYDANLLNNQVISYDANLLNNSNFVIPIDYNNIYFNKLINDNNKLKKEIEELKCKERSLESSLSWSRMDNALSRHNQCIIS